MSWRNKCRKGLEGGRDFCVEYHGYRLAQRYGYRSLQGLSLSSPSTRAAPKGLVKVDCVQQFEQDGPERNERNGCKFGYQRWMRCGRRAACDIGYVAMIGEKWQRRRRTDRVRSPDAIGALAECLRDRVMEEGRQGSSVSTTTLSRSGL